MPKPTTAPTVTIYCANCATPHETIVTGYEKTIMMICRNCGQVVICDLAVNNE